MLSQLPTGCYVARTELGDRIIARFLIGQSHQFLVRESRLREQFLCVGPRAVGSYMHRV